MNLHILNLKIFGSIYKEVRPGLIKNYPKQKTLRMLDTLFSAIETNIKIDGTSSRVMKMETVKLEKPNVRITKMKEAPFL
jgi:hypothetical protein